MNNLKYEKLANSSTKLYQKKVAKTQDSNINSNIIRVPLGQYKVSKLTLITPAYIRKAKKYNY
jgi:hypothetical protein